MPKATYNGKKARHTLAGLHFERGIERPVSAAASKVLKKHPDFKVVGDGKNAGRGDRSRVSASRAKSRGPSANG